MFGEVVEQIDSVFSVGATFLVNLLHFNYLFVSALASSFHTVVLLICNILCSLICACGYALNDLIVFVSEVIRGILMLLTFIGETLDYVKLTVQCFFYSVTIWATSLFGTFCKNIVTLLQLAHYLIGLVFSAIILLLQFFPLLFVQIIVGVMNMLSYTMLQAKYLLYCMTEVPKNVVDVFLEIPPGAYLGCLMLLASCITVKLIRYLFRAFSFNLQSLLIVNKLRFLVLHSCIFAVYHIRWMTSWLALHRAEPEEEVSIGIEEDDPEDYNVDEEPDNEDVLFVEEMPRRNRLSLDTSSEDSSDELVKVDLFSLKSRLQKERERLLCVICQDNAKCMMLLPCRHLCMCQNCVSVIMEDRNICPICRRSIHEVMRVYL